MNEWSWACERTGELWPDRLGALQPPLQRVHVRGRMPPEEAHWIAVVGSREADRHALVVTARFVEAFAGQPVVIVSGGARGVDAAAHAAALHGGLPTVAVLAGGLDRAGPAVNRPLFRRIEASGGALLSEDPDGVRPGRGAFPRRNRLIAALADVTVLVSAAEGSGSLHTARWARRLDRPVFAVPGDITSALSRGCNRLIARGEAALLFNPMELSGLTGSRGGGWPPPGARSGPPPAAWSAPLEMRAPEESRDDLLEALKEHMRSIDRSAGELAQASGRPMAQVQASLQRGCLSGSVLRLPGNRYIVAGGV